MIIKVNTPLPCRLDKYLRLLYPKLTQGFIEKALRQKQITVNSCKVEASLRVAEGEEIYINDKLNLPMKFTADLPQEELQETNFTNSAIKLANKLLKDYLVYEDENFIAVNKPAGLAVQGGSKINLSIDDALKYLNYKGGDFKLVHRLDKETSGVLLVAKNYTTSVKLHHAFKEKLIVKTYLATTYGKPPKNSGEIQNFIGKKREGNHDVIDIDEENGKLAITYYKLLKTLANNLFLMEFKPITGRMHQLRLHAKLLNCPIIGDDKYGNKQPYSKYMLLHATKIILPAEIFGKEIVLEAELPDYFIK